MTINCLTRRLDKMIRNQTQGTQAKSVRAFIETWADLANKFRKATPAFMMGFSDGYNKRNVHFEYDKWTKPYQEIYEYGRLAGIWSLRNIQSAFKSSSLGLALLPWRDPSEK